MMQIRFSRNTRNILLSSVCLSAVALTVGCKKKNTTPGATTAAGGSLPSITAHPLAIEAQIAHAEILAHVGFANLEQSAEQIGKSLTPVVSGKDGVAKIRAGLKEGGDLGELADKIEFNKPMGCAIFDPQAYSDGGQWPASCVLSVQGGVKAIVAALHGDGDAADSAGHAAKLQHRGKDIYLDELEGAVVLSGATDLFAKSKDYLAQQILHDKDAHAMRAAIYLKATHAKYASSVKPMLGLLAMQGAGSNDPAEKMAHDLTQERINRMVAGWGEAEQLVFHFDVSDKQLTFSTSLRAGDQAPTMKDMTIAQSEVLDPTLLQRLPKNAALVLASKQDYQRFFADSTLVETMKPLDAMLVSKMGEHAAIGPLFAKSVAASVGLWEGSSAAALIQDSGRLPAITVLSKLKSGADMSKANADSVASLKEYLTANELTKWVQLEHEAGAVTVEGVKFDKIALVATKEAKEAMQASEPSADAQRVLKLIEPMQFSWYIGQHDGLAVLVGGVGDVSSYVTRVALGAIGKESGEPEIHAFVEQAAGNSMAVALSAKAIVDILKVVVPPGDLAELPTFSGSDFDLVSRGRFEKEGHMAWELQVETAAIKTIAAKSKLGI